MIKKKFLPNIHCQKVECVTKFRDTKNTAVLSKRPAAALNRGHGRAGERHGGVEVVCDERWGGGEGGNLDTLSLQAVPELGFEVVSLDTLVFQQVPGLEEMFVTTNQMINQRTPLPDHRGSVPGRKDGSMKSSGEVKREKKI